MGVPLSRFNDVTITRSTRTVARRSFNVAMLCGYHTVSLGRVLEYQDPSEMIAAGFSVRHPLYLAAVAFKAQEPSPSRFKIGRRAGAPTQTMRFTPSTPATGEVFTVTIGGVVFSVTAAEGDAVGDVLDDLVALINPDVDAIVATGATSGSAQELTDSELDGTVGTGTMSPPRNVTFTLDAHADWDASSIVVTGTDVNGRTITETFTVPDGGDATLTGTRLFATVTQVDIDAQSGTGGTFTMGKGGLFSNPDLAITATDGATYMDVAANTAGAWFSMQASTNLSLNDETADPATGIAVDLAAIAAADADWYGLDIVDAQSHAQIAAATAWVESDGADRIYVPHTADSDVPADVETDIAQTLADAEYLSAKILYSRNGHGSFPAAALLGRVFGAGEPGAVSWEHKGLTGITPDDLTAAEITRLVGTNQSPTASKRAMIYIGAQPAGTNNVTGLTWGGLTSGGEWADIVQGLDALKARLQEVALNLPLSTPKVPFTRKGIARHAGQVEAVLAEFSTEPYNLLDEEGQAVNPTPLESTTVEDRAARFYDGVYWGSRVQGAIRATKTTGNVTP